MHPGRAQHCFCVQLLHMKGFYCQFDLVLLQAFNLVEGVVEFSKIGDRVRELCLQELNCNVELPYS
jgi:hypothetical protein